MAQSRNAVASAWRDDQAQNGANVFTNGNDVYSYAHRVGITSPLGEKVAYDCHYSVTTAKHCSAFKAVADKVLDHCPSCNGKVGRIAA